MNYKMIAKLIGLLLFIEAGLLIPPAIVALIYEESLIPYIVSAAIMIVAAIPLFLIKPKVRDIYAKEGFVTVALMWISLSVFGALPFVFSGAIPNYIDALFETVSGFTTTGASILTEVESLPRGVLFWRSFTHWIGGMGVLVFMLAIIPSAGGGAIHLMRAEVPGPTKGKLVPKIKHSAIILYSIYLFMTIAETIALILADMPLYDSVINAFGTMGTGGFSVRNASIASYNNPAAEWIIAIFLLLSGINYNLYYYILIRRYSDVIKNEELKLYLALTLVATAIITLNVWFSAVNTFDSVGDCIRTAFFQVTSIMSTAGFSTANFNLWPELSKTLLVLLMFLGACAGSTAGGLKISRFIIILKTMKKEIRHVLHPTSVAKIRVDGEVIPESTTRSAMNYLSFYTLGMAASLLLISFDGFDFTTNATAVISCVNNIGPGLGAVGPMGNFAGYSLFSKFVLSLTMLFGRLEIMPMIILLTPSWIKKKH